MTEYIAGKDKIEWLDDHIYLVVEPDQDPQSAPLMLASVDGDSVYLVEILSAVSDTPEDGWKPVEYLVYPGCVVIPQF